MATPVNMNTLPSSGVPTTVNPTVLSAGSAAASTLNTPPGSAASTFNTPPGTVAPAAAKIYSAVNANVGSSTASQIGALSTGSASTFGAAQLGGGQDSTNAATQLNDITSSNSPAMALAAQQGYLSAAGRGLGNSSLASGASEAALVAGATPLAQQNAQEAEAAKAQNTQLQTQASEFNSAQDTAAKEQQASLNTQNSQANVATQAAMAQFNAQSVNTANATTVAAQNSMTQLAQQLTTELKNTYTSGQQAQALANVQGQWSSLISSNSAAASLYGQMLSSIGTMMNNQNLGPNQAAAGVTALITQLNSALTVMNEIQGGTLGVTKEATGGSSSTTPAKPGTTTPTTSPLLPGNYPVVAHG